MSKCAICGKDVGDVEIEIKGRTADGEEKTSVVCPHCIIEKGLIQDAEVLELIRELIQST